MSDWNSVSHIDKLRLPLHLIRYDYDYQYDDYEYDVLITISYTVNDSSTIHF